MNNAECAGACALLVCGWWSVFALYGDGPVVWLGAWLNARAAAKSLRLLNRIAYFAWDQAEDLTP